jgi:hypothetical protein
MCLEKDSKSSPKQPFDWKTVQWKVAYNKKRGIDVKRAQMVEDVSVSLDERIIFEERGDLKCTISVLRIWKKIARGTNVCKKKIEYTLHYRWIRLLQEKWPTIALTTRLTKKGRRWDERNRLIVHLFRSPSDISPVASHSPFPPSPSILIQAVKESS